MWAHQCVLTDNNVRFHSSYVPNQRRLHGRLLNIIIRGMNLRLALVRLGMGTHKENSGFPDTIRALLDAQTREFKQATFVGLLNVSKSS